MAHVAEYKKRIVDDLAKLMIDYPVVAVVSVESVPAPQLQKVRAQIRDNVVVMMSKRRLFKIAIEKANETKKGIDKLNDHLGGMPALMFTKENPFKLEQASHQDDKLNDHLGGMPALMYQCLFLFHLPSQKQS